MKLAKAMRYGGELIDACDCDYSDFKKLIPLCPNCSEPVFLRKECDRVSTLGKEFKIPKHWVHFDSTSEEQKAACEARVSSYTEADRQKIQRKARGQRLKLIQRWFWRVIGDHKESIVVCGDEWDRSLRLNDINQVPQDVIELILERYWAEELYPLALDFICSVTSCLVEVFQAQGVNHTRDQMINIAITLADRARENSLKGPEEEKEKFARRLSRVSNIEINQQNRIALECLRFLCSKRNAPTLTAVCCQSVVAEALSRSDAVADFVQGRTSRAEMHRLLLRVGANIPLTLIEIPWASEFARLEAESRQVKSLI